jgi:NADH:ubiquinone oxidoreductase subunit 2 (subunit N)
MYLYNSTEWVLLNFLYLIQSNQIDLNYLLITLINFVLIFAFLIKIGLTPIHLYKLEIYKGLPYISIFFYTTFYFFIFFLFFVLLLLNHLGAFSLSYWYLLFLTIIIGIFYTISLLFNVNLLKVFFAYSTIINSLGFVCAALSLLCF